MYYSPYYRNYREPEKSFIRLLHASPDAPPVDVYVNNKLIARNLAYKQFTEYLSSDPGVYNVKIYASGKLTPPIIDTTLTLEANKILTIAAADKLKNLKLLPYEEPKLYTTPGKAYVKFVHLSPNTPPVDITLPDGTILFKNTAFTEGTEYLPVDRGIYTLQARPTGTSKIALTVPNVRLKPGRFYTVYAVGLLNKNPPLQVLIPLDGNSYIDL